MIGRRHPHAPTCTSLALGLGPGLSLAFAPYAHWPSSKLDPGSLLDRWISIQIRCARRWGLERKDGAYSLDFRSPVPFALHGLVRARPAHPDDDSDSDAPHIE
ncbi:hypothetical protein C8J57DRAFT_1517042 [Mycena rebaudengoi]|nr:hypothetical protein C8J57DRAFT_1517042 [Mycena rebaudengoi]